MRLLITTDNFIPRWDGITRFLTEIIPRMKYDIKVVAPDFKGDCEDLGISIVRIPLSGRVVDDYPSAKWDYKSVKAAVSEADVVFNQTLGPIGMSAIIAAKKLGKPLVSFTHSLEWELVPRAMNNSLIRKFSAPLTRVVDRYFLKKADLLIVPSEPTADELSWHGITTAKRVVHLGVDTNKFKPKPKAVVRKKLGLPDDSLIIGYHGRIAYEKNLVTLLRAFLRIKKRKKKLLIVGDGIDAIKRKLKRRDVIITGFRNDVVDWINAMDLYVMPSYTETTSLSVLEAMACERPVISSRVGYIAHYIRDGENGFFFNNRDSYDLYSKIMFALDKDLKPISRAARKTVIENFIWETTAREIIKIIDSYAKSLRMKKP